VVVVVVVVAVVVVVVIVVVAVIVALLCLMFFIPVVPPGYLRGAQRTPVVKRREVVLWLHHLHGRNLKTLVCTTISMPWCSQPAVCVID